MEKNTLYHMTIPDACNFRVGQCLQIEEPSRVSQCFVVETIPERAIVTIAKRHNIVSDTRNWRRFKFGIDLDWSSFHNID